MADVIGKNPLFVTSIRLVMAQRLVRRLDDSTKVAYQPDEATRDSLRRIVESLPANIQRPDMNNITLYRAGSSEENPYGYRGQIPLREQFTMSDQLRQTLEQHVHGVTTEKLETAAIASGMRTMLQDGVLKVLAGETTVEEVYRVIG
jgi:type II secretory ATPase GspE/PulE/Tfp pilus assembly ATPase PilB-like protein